MSLATPLEVRDALRGLLASASTAQDFLLVDTPIDRSDTPEVFDPVGGTTRPVVYLNWPGRLRPFDERTFLEHRQLVFTTWAYCEDFPDGTGYHEVTRLLTCCYAVLSDVVLGDGQGAASVRVRFDQEAPFVRRAPELNRTLVSWSRWRVDWMRAPGG